MKMDDTAVLAPQTPTVGASPEVFQQLGAITRQQIESLITSDKPARLGGDGLSGSEGGGAAGGPELDRAG